MKWIQGKSKKNLKLEAAATDLTLDQLQREYNMLCAQVGENNLKTQIFEGNVEFLKKDTAAKLERLSTINEAFPAARQKAQEEAKAKEASSEVAEKTA